MEMRRIHVSKRYFRLILPVILLISFLVPLAHAATYIGFTNANNTAGCNGITLTDCQTPPTNVHSFGEVILNPLTGNPAVLISVSLSVAGPAPDRLIIATFPAGTNPTIVSNTFCSNTVNNQCGNVASAQTFTAIDIESISGLSTSNGAGGAFQTIALANPQTISANSWVAITFIQASANFALMDCDKTCTSPPSSQYAGIDLTWPSGTPVNGNTATTTQSAAAGTIVGGTFQPTGSSSGVTAITQCYGNCGTPAVTLANTNSTHGFNFNQTTTFFYEFQSNLNGFILNVTTSIAKTYTNQFVSLGIYEIASCAQGVTPFSGACPGLLIQGGNVGSNPLLKGKASMGIANGQIAVQNGQWVGISVTATYSGLDLNDTNTNVALFQTSGANPPAITASSQTSCACKMGLWAFIAGNIVTGPGPVTPSTGCPSLATIDCFFPAAINGLCSNVTVQCQSSSALIWILGLAIFTEAALAMTFQKVSPGSKIPMGETFTFIFLTWTFVMTGLSLIFIWVPVFFFMIGSLAFSKHTGTFF